MRFRKRYLIPLLGIVLLITAILIPLSGATMSTPKKLTVYSNDGRVIGYVETEDNYMTLTGVLFITSFIAGLVITVFGTIYARNKDC